MTIADNVNHRAAWLDRARRAIRTLDDLRYELDIAVRSSQSTRQRILLGEVDVHLERAQNDIDAAITRVTRL